MCRWTSPTSVAGDGNFVITDNLAIGPEDYDRYSITAPTHPDLPGGGGYVVDGRTTSSRRNSAWHRTRS